MGRKTVRVPIPTASPGKMNDLVKDIWEQHTTLGASSPFNGNTLVNMTLYETLMTEALEARKQADAHYAHAHRLMEKWRVLTGIDKGQAITTPETLYNLINAIKQVLLVKADGNEEALSEWGFNVVVRTSKHPVRKKKV